MIPRLAVPAFLFAAGSAFASSGGEVEMVPFFSSNFLWAVINFSILAVVLYKFGKKPFQDALKSRQENIEKALRDAEEAKIAAEKSLADVEARLRAKDEEIKAIVEEAKEVAEKEREKMVALGREMSEQIAGQTRDRLDHELKNARQTLQAEAVILAMEIAEKRIREAVDPETQARLVAESLEKMEGMN
jgi:F-type H+-transporting ATPase subunit b